MLSDIFPTGFHGARTAGVDVGSTVYIAGAGPVGLAAAASAQLLGAAVVIIGDRNEKRLAHAKKAGFEIINITIDAVGFDDTAASPKPLPPMSSISSWTYLSSPEASASPASMSSKIPAHPTKKRSTAC
jgi:shikimate 5-dehydrogenase